MKKKPAAKIAKKNPAKKNIAKKNISKNIGAAKKNKGAEKVVKKDNSKTKNIAKKDPVKNVVKKDIPKKEVEKKVEKKAEKKEVVKKELPKKEEPRKEKDKFKVGDHAIYPSHGVGKILEIENTVIGGQKFSLMTMHFEKEKLSIKIPTDQIEKIGIRHLATKEQMNEVFGILRSGVKKLKGMWSRRAQEYESKINSGDIKLLAEVLRDLTRDIEDGDRSYSERIIYETAIYRLASEYSAVYNILFEKARDEVTAMAKNKLGSSAKDKVETTVKKDEFDDEFEAEEEVEDEEGEEEDEEEEEEDDED